MEVYDFLAKGNKEDKPHNWPGFLHNDTFWAMVQKIEEPTEPILINEIRQRSAFGASEVVGFYGTVYFREGSSKGKELQKSAKGGPYNFAYILSIE